MPTSSDVVNVLGFKDADGNWGVSFHGAFLDLPGGASFGRLIRFMVEVGRRAAQRKASGSPTPTCPSPASARRRRIVLHRRRVVLGAEN